jgi:hypothetical protein
VIVIVICVFFFFVLLTLKEKKDKKVDKIRIKKEPVSINPQCDNKNLIKNPCEFIVFRNLSVIILNNDSNHDHYNLPMTRSPLHTIAFFILFAAINEKDRQDVIKKLNIEGTPFHISFTSTDFRLFIEMFDWESLEPECIKIKSNRSNIFQIQKNLKINFPQISLERYFVEESINEVIVSTTVVFKPIWKSEFEESEYGWKIPQNTFRISGSLPSKSIENDLFKFDYAGEDACGVDIYMEGKEDKTLSVFEKDVHPGVYNVFIGCQIMNISIAEVIVKISGNLTMTKKGATFRQTQDVIVLESFYYPPPKSKLIFKKMIIYLEKVGVIAVLNSNTLNNERNGDFQMEIFTKNDTEKVMLLCSKDDVNIYDIIGNSRFV